MRMSPEYDLSEATWQKSSYSGASGGDCLEIARWQKSSYSGGSGGDCLEVGRWRKSTHSDSSGGDCLEVRDDLPDIVPVRDSKAAPHGPTLVFRAAAWTAFLAGVKGSDTAA
ncbi:DUF397 domain-containing protein [Streptomyces sp. NBC_00083]|uniref:DUF397 domain-containing protein n=1 Tax=Streptomyces sp. NBC_00083 TaxID=2975647 RepID=UPI002258AA05|nr:DUF397 domain-containing protein [Streptomyces sp. NBC_00083]MCX5387880.1 DUF397 domain-containing protein [Streptomyces sp. NBC_00083]